MKLKIPNILTIGRIIIVPIFVFTFFIPGFFGDLIPFFYLRLLVLQIIWMVFWLECLKRSLNLVNF